MTPIILTGCSRQPERKREDKPEDVTPVEPEVTAENITDEQLKDFPSYFLRKLASFNTYEAVTSGHTDAYIFGLKVEQSIEVKVIRDEYSYLINESHSSMVNTVHTAYFHEKQTLYKDNNADYTKAELNAYLEIYGTYPFDSAIEGYSIGEGSIISVSRMEKDGSNYRFKVEFDKDKATNNVKIQMKQFGGLDEYPSFVDNTTMEISVKEDFTPVSLHLNSHYNAKKFMTTECYQDYIVTYSHYNETVTIPDKESIIEKFSK